MSNPDYVDAFSNFTSLPDYNTDSADSYTLNIDFKAAGSYTIDIHPPIQLNYYCVQCGKEMENLCNENEQPLGGAVLCEECSERIGGRDYYDKEKYKMREEIIYV